MSAPANPFLAAAAVLNALAALLHLGCIVFGGPWYRFFGAGERMVRLAAAGSWTPVLVTLGIASVLSLWSLYALSGAGIIMRLPFLRAALWAIAAVYLIRAISGPVLAHVATDRSVAFWWWSS